MTTTTESPSPTRRVGAVGLILCAMLAFALQDVAVKAIAGETSLWQLQAVRSGITLAILVAAGRLVFRGAALLPGAWRWPLVRSTFMAGAYLFFYASLPLLTLSQAASTFFVGPLLITLLAALLLGERIGPRRVVAIVVGFAGVLLIVRPSDGEVQPAALLPLAAALCYALGIIITRMRCTAHSALSLTATHNALYLLIGLVALAVVPLVPFAPEDREAFPFLTRAWLPLGGLALAAIAATAVAHIVGMVCSIRAYRDEEASRIAPFEYAYLAIMPVFDLAIWGTVPRWETFAGMALIAGSGIFVAWREGRPARPRVVPAADDPWTRADEAGKETR